MTGWISLHRSIRKHWLYEEDRKFSRFEAWVDLLLEANHDDEKIIFDGSLITVKRSENLTSLRKLAERWRWSITKVNSFLKILEEDEMITLKKDTKKTIVTIVNYDLYQNKDLEKRHRKKSEKTQKETGSNAEKTQKKTNNNINNLNNSNNDNKTDDIREVISFYENNGYGTISQSSSEEIVGWLDEGFEKDAIIKALKIGVDSNSRTVKYIRGIFNNWRNKNLKTVSDIEANEKNRTGSFRKQSELTEENKKLIQERKAQREADLESDYMPFG